MSPETKNTGTVSEATEALQAAVEESARQALEAAEARENELEQRLDHFHELSAELESKRDQLARLEVEESELPQAAFKANMAGDESEENALRARYRAVLDELPATRSRCEAIEHELSGMYDPQRTKDGRESVDDAVRFKQRTAIRPGAPTAEARAELTRLRQSILETIDAAMWSCSPDNSAAVARKHGLEKNREEAKRILRN